MKNFTLKIFMMAFILSITGYSYGQFKFGDKSTVGQTLVQDGATGVSYRGPNTKKVAYVNNADLVMAETAASITNDPIIQMLQADPNIELDVLLVAVDSVIDLSGYAVVIAQEGFSSSGAIYKPGGSLGMGSIPVPFILNKVFTMKAGRGFATGAAGSGGEVRSTYSINISNANKNHDLFKGMTISKGVSQILISGANDDGGEGTKSLQYATDVVITGDNTLLASGVNDPATATVCVNDIPAGETIGSEVLKARMIALGMNYGAICKDGNNLTADGLTLWRNAVYSLAGIVVPSTKVDNSNEIKEIATSVGMVKINNDAGMVELVLPAGAASATLTVTPVTEGAVVSAATIEASVGNTYEVSVTAPIGGAPKVYTITVSAQSEGEILYVSSDSYGIYSEARPYDTNVYDALVEAGYSVTMVKKDALVAEGFDYTPYAGLVLSGGADSSNVNGYAVSGYPIPCVSMQNDGAKNDKWGWVNYKNAAEYHATKVYDVTTAQIKITNNTHPITAGYALNEMITWSLGTADSVYWAGKEIKSYNLADSIPEAIALATIPADGTLFPILWAVPGGTTVRTLQADKTYKSVPTNSNIVLMYIYNDGLLYASPGFGTLLAKSLDWAINCVTVEAKKKIAYVTFDKVMAETAASPAEDPIIKMLQSDPNFEVTVMVVSADSVFSLAGYDVAVAQEGFSSGAAIFMPGHSLGLENFTIPFVYNKAYALRNGKAVTSATSSAAELAGELLINVPVASQSSPLFSGITFTTEDIQLFKRGAADDGADTQTKAYSYTLNLEMSDATTLLAKTKGAPETVSVCFNDIPAGTVLGAQDTLKARMIAISQNFGAITKDKGTNFTDEGLTIWRNAIYMAAGLEVPTTLVAAPDSIHTRVAQLNSSDISIRVYPNPATNYAKVQFTLNQKETVSLNLYNMVGQEIEISKNEVLFNGDHEITINTQSLRNGLYVYRLKVGAGVISGKLNVAK